MERTRAAQTQLLPISELTPSLVGSIRNSAIEQLVGIVASELKKPMQDLVVRDIEPYTDLYWNYGSASVGAVENWERDMTLATCGYVQVNSNTVMADQRYVIIFGVRDQRYGVGATADATSIGGDVLPVSNVSLIKFVVGGRTVAIWDTSHIMGLGPKVAFSPSAIIIPQNIGFQISYYQKNVDSMNTAFATPSYIQLVGVTVEPRGKTISP